MKKTKASELKKRIDQVTSDEAVDVGAVIKSLIDAKPSDDNEEQGKIVQLLRGLAFSDDPKSTAFMKKLTSLISDANFGSLTK